MPPTKLAVTTGSLAPQLRPALDLAAGGPATGVVIDAHRELKPSDLGETGRRQFLHQLDERGLRVAALVFPTQRTFYEQQGLDERVAATRNAMQFAFQLRAPLLLVRVGHVPDDPQSPPYRLLVEVLNDLARHGNHVGTALALTPANDGPAALAALLGEITAGPIGVDLDPAAFVLANHSPVEAARTLHDRLLHVRLRDAVRDVDGSGLEVPVGRGEVDWLEFLPTLVEVGYTGWHTAVRTTGDDRPGDTLRALRYVQSVLPST
jgi:sugar phosphate isomerase/epimerase